MELPGEYFYVKCSNDHMSAQLYCKDDYEKCVLNTSEEAMIQFLRDSKIVYGVEQQVVKLLLKRLPVESFPYTIARGKPAKCGKDGEIKQVLHFNTVVERSPDWNFRDVMRIPSVEKGLSGQKKGKIQAAENINIGYINEGKVQARNDLFIEHSTKHSECAVEDKLQLIDPQLGSELAAKLVVRNNMYANVIISFGKYKRIIKSDYHYIEMKVANNEIVIQPLFK